MILDPSLWGTYAGTFADWEEEGVRLPKPYYERDGITIYCADCRDILPHLKADIIITDPPYNCGKNYGTATNDNLPWPEWCAWWDGCLELMAGAAPDILAFMSQTAYRQYVRLGQHEMDWTLCWHKPLALACCALPFMPHWEPIAYWGVTRKKDIPPSATSALWGGDVLSHNVERNRHGHPTEKPLKLMRDLVSRFNGVILDPFCGSGTTLRAARDLGKQAIGIEIEEKWCALAAKRQAQEVMPL